YGSLCDLSSFPTRRSSDLITVMVDVMRMPDNSFGYVPTPAIVAPIEFSMKLEDYERLGGHIGDVQSISEVLAKANHRIINWVDPASPWPIAGKPVLG